MMPWERVAGCVNGTGEAVDCWVGAGDVMGFYSFEIGEHSFVGPSVVSDKSSPFVVVISVASDPSS